MRKADMKIFLSLILTYFCLSGYSYAFYFSPYTGNITVNKKYAFSSFKFNSAAIESFNTDWHWTYEHDIIVKNKGFANIGSYSTSNLPYPYLDTQFLDSFTGDADVFSMGSYFPLFIKPEKKYYTYIKLKNQNARVKSSRVGVRGQLGKRGLYGNPWWRHPQNVYPVIGDYLKWYNSAPGSSSW